MTILLGAVSPTTTRGVVILLRILGLVLVVQLAVTAGFRPPTTTSVSKSNPLVFLVRPQPGQIWENGYNNNGRKPCRALQQWSALFSNMPQQEGDDDDNRRTSQTQRRRRRWQIPLLDSTQIPPPTDSPKSSSTGPPQAQALIQALPGSHLPNAFSSSLHVYVMDMTLPIHKTIVDAAMANAIQHDVDDDLLGNDMIPMDDDNDSSSNDWNPGYYFGQIAAFRNKNKNDDAVAAALQEEQFLGAIGCVVQILSPSLTMFMTNNDSDNDNATGGKPNDDVPSTKTKTTSSTTQPQSVLCRGLFRFVVQDIKQTIPFPIAIVEELFDDNEDEAAEDMVENNKVSDTPKNWDLAHMEEDDDDDDDEDDDLFDDYAKLSPQELEQRLMQALQEYVDQQLANVDEQQQNMSPLERSLLEESNDNTGIHLQREAAEETAALFQVFQHYVVDELSYQSTPYARWYALSFFAAELTEVDTKTRQAILQCTNGFQRLCIVTQTVEDVVRMGRARKMAQSVTDQTDELQRDLTIGKPPLPPKSVFGKGTTWEYFWNEELGWLEGTVVKDAEIVNEESMIVTIQFPTLRNNENDDNDDIHQIPFYSDEKARWRPTRR